MLVCLGTSPTALCKPIRARQSAQLYHNFCRLQLGVSSPLHRYSMPASPSSLLFSFSSVRDGFVLMIEERSLQLLLERLQSSSLKEKERWGLLVLRVSLAEALPRKAKRPTYASLGPGTPPEGCMWATCCTTSQTSASMGQKAHSA